MKKPLLAMLPLLLCLTITAQRNRVNDLDTENFFRFGGKAGTNVYKVPGKSFKDFSYNYTLGGFLQFNIGRRFGLQPEVNFTQASSYQSNEVTEIFDDLTRDGDQRGEKLNYLEIPILVNMNLGESRHVKLQMGPSYGIMLNKPVVDPIKNPGHNYLTKNGEISMIGGFWLQVPFLNIGARYKMGLSKVKLGEESWRNQAIQVFIGFTF